VITPLSSVDQRQHEKVPPASVSSTPLGPHSHQQVDESVISSQKTSQFMDVAGTMLVYNINIILSNFLKHTVCLI